MAKINWQSPGTSGDWNTATNWNGNAVPGTGDDVTLGGGKNVAGYIVTLSGNAASINSLTINGPTSGTTELNLVNDSLSMTGNLTLSPGTEILGDGSIQAAQLSGAGIIEASGGTLTITAALDPTKTTASTLQIADGASLIVDGDIGAAAGGKNAAVTPSLTFLAGTNETFADTTVPMGSVHLGTITGFTTTDAIQLQAATGGDHIVINQTDVSVYDSSGTLLQTFTFATDMTSSGIHLTDNGGVDTLSICFMAGTMIRTPDGEVAVETLKRGDLVMTTDGVAKPVCWLGKQTVSATFADPVRSWPIRVKAGALGENVPGRDLLLSPNHALMVDGIMINAGALVNGTSILRERVVPEVFVYYHVELEDHSLILAEGAPAETFVDNVDRMNFDNWSEYEALYPDGKTVEELPYPRAKAHRQVPVYIRVMLAERAMKIGAVAQGAAVA